MNKKLYYVASLIVATMVGLLAGCTKQGEDWVKADKVMITLDAAGVEPEIITVEASTSWTATPSDTWIQIATEGNTMTVTAIANEEVAERTGMITLTAGSATMEINVVQMGHESLTARYRFMTDMQSAGISPSGKYVACYAARVAESGDTLEYDLYLINLETNEQTLIGSYAQSLYEFNFVRCVTDEGVAILDHNMTYSVVFEKGEVEYMVEDFDGIISPRIEATSGDGSIWVGYGVGENGFVPIKYVDGVPERMEMPETNFRGAAVGQVVVRGCSLDGSMAYGSTWDNLDFGMLYWDAEGHVHWAGKDIYEVTPVELIGMGGEPYTYNIVTGLQVQADAFNMSPNGRYIGGMYYKEEPNSDNTDIVTTQIAAVYDTVEEKTIILSDYAGRGGVTAVTDEGIALVATSSLALYCQTIMVDLATGENLGSTLDYVMDKFGVMLPSSHGVTYLPVGGKTAWGEEAAPGGNMLWFWYVASK